MRPSRPDQVEKFGKMGMRIVRARRRLRVILHRENRKCFVPKAFHGSVVQIDVGDLEIGRAGDAVGGPVHRESVILRRDEHPSGGQFPNGVISAPMPVGKLAGASAERQARRAGARGRCRRWAARTTPALEYSRLRIRSPQDLRDRWTKTGRRASAHGPGPASCRRAPRSPGNRRPPASGRCSASCRSRRPRRGSRGRLRYGDCAPWPRTPDPALPCSARRAAAR